MIAAALMMGNSSYGYFSMQTMNIYSPSSNFSYPTAAIYYSNRNFGGCVGRENNSDNQNFSLGSSLIIFKENSSRYTPILSTTQVVQ
jgi:hypothetical protein